MLLNSIRKPTLEDIKPVWQSRTIIICQFDFVTMSLVGLSLQIDLQFINAIFYIIGVNINN